MRNLSAIITFVIVLIVAVAAEYLPCVICSNTCPAKGQYLFPFDNVYIADAEEASHFKRMTNEAHPGWVLTASSQDAVTRITVTPGPKWTVHYIISLFYTSPDVGIFEQVVYLDAPDVCWRTTRDITVPNLYYASVYQTKAAAIKDQLCALYSNEPPFSTFNKRPIARFSEKDFRQYNPLITPGDRRFTAEYHMEREMVKLSAPESQTEYNTYVFDIKHFSRGSFQLGLRSGESCWYFLADNARWDQDYIDVYLAKR